jgi:hypothetical protein
MAMQGETRSVRDPFSGKTVHVSDRLTDRLRGRYAVGPTLPDGEPEFGWNQFETPPIQHEAADEIDRLRKENYALRAQDWDALKALGRLQNEDRTAAKDIDGNAPLTP